MATVFLDSSAVVRRYARSEPGAAQVRALCEPAHGNTILVARITSVEVASALSRKAREGEVSSLELNRLWRVFRGHWRRQYQVMPLGADIYRRAEQLLFAHALRAYDAVQIGCVLIAVEQYPDLPLEFWTADQRQAQIAAAEGLPVRLVN
ncbi:MAG: type II toxin-antitoxin system VapC family toxin [Thermomicrobiales bacterium]